MKYVMRDFSGTSYFRSRVGDPLVDTFKTVVDEKTGHYELEKDEFQVRNLYEEIQCHRDSVDIHKIVDRYRKGDVSVLQRVQGFYDDVSSMPKNIFEAMELQRKVVDNFERLPIDVKQRFGNSPYQYALLAGSQEWFDKLGVDPAPAGSVPAIEKIEKEVSAE